MPAQMASEADEALNRGAAGAFFFDCCSCAPIASFSLVSRFFDLLLTLFPFSPSPLAHPNHQTTKKNRARKSPRRPACSPPCSTTSSPPSSGAPGPSGCCSCSGRAAPPRARPRRSTPGRSSRSRAARRRPTPAAPTARCRCSTTRTRTRTPPPRPTLRNPSRRPTRRSPTRSRGRTTRSTATPTGSSRRG